MYKKTCDKCTRPSYSSSEFGKWICPHCKRDLTHIKKLKAEQHVVNPYEKEVRKRKVKILTKVI